MFTGIITHQAVIDQITFNPQRDAILTLRIASATIDRKLELGCSVSCNGICLTLITLNKDRDDLLLSFQASDETCQKTTLRDWQKDAIINIEFAMRLGDEFGGHLVSGHVDDISQITKITSVQDSWRFEFTIPSRLKKFISPKGSITINGTSLTVNEVYDNIFSVNIINHTMQNTNFRFLKINHSVNLEIDLIARYLEQITKKYD